MARADRATVLARALALLAGIALTVLAAAHLPAAAEADGCARQHGTSAGERLIGTSANDCMRGGGGPDRIVGRGGGDNFRARDGHRDLVRCGRGRDVARVDRYDRVRACERVRVSRRKRPHKPVPAPSAPTTGTAVGPCSISLVGLSESNCTLLLEDFASAADPTPTWGRIDCEHGSRHLHSAGGADGSPSALGAAQGDDAYRRLTVLDGDDVWGERCELGLNNHEDGPTTLYREGQRRLTSFSVRLPANYPLSASTWQLVMQMKQTQPAANGGGTPVLSLEARAGQWRLLQSTSVEASSGSHVLWSAPAESGRWTRFALDVTYSQHPSQGLIKVYADLNSDGDSADPGEQSPGLATYTLKRETAGGSSSDGIAAGESIPSHLRLGIYHDPAVSCPPPAGCSVDVDNVQVVAPS